MKAKLIEKKYLVTFILVTTLFALWGFANDITNPMVAAFQTLMELTAAKASMVQFAFYGGYATMAIPAALFIRKYSYKGGILLGLALYATGAFLFIPAAAQQSSGSAPPRPAAFCFRDGRAIFCLLPRSGRDCFFFPDKPWRSGC